MTTIGAKAAAAAAAMLSNPTSFYAAHDLTPAEVDNFVNKGCFRGQYGNRDNLFLLTCPPTPDAVPFAEVEGNSFLCVAELEEGGLPAAQRVMDSARLDADDSTRVLYQDEDHLVMMEHGDQAVRPDMCCPSHFGGAVENVLMVPKQAVAPLKPMDRNNDGVARCLEQNPPQKTEIAAALNAWDKDRVRSNVIAIATDNEGTNSRITRNSYAIEGSPFCPNSQWACADNAVDDIEDRVREIFQGSGLDVTFEQETFRADMCNNLIVTIKGESDDVVVSGSHLDSRNVNRNGDTNPAPGADDNASGSAVHLEMARVIVEQGLRFNNTIKMMWYCGEEQGLIGSAALADAAVRNGDNVIASFNQDMIGYTDPNDNNGEPIVSFMGRGNSSPELTECCKKFSLLYIPDLEVGDSGVCCSDQQSWHTRGFHAAGVFETRANFVRYPFYHVQNDRWDNGEINYDQVSDFGKSIFASILEYAVPIAKEAVVASQ